MNRAWAFRVTSDRDIVFVATARNSVFLADRGGEELDVGCGEFGAGSQPVVEVQVRATATVSGGCAGQRKRRDLVFLSLATLVLVLTAVSNVVCLQRKPNQPQKPNILVIMGDDIGWSTQVQHRTTKPKKQ
jgi:hypothetical protein